MNLVQLVSELSEVEMSKVDYVTFFNDGDISLLYGQKIDKVDVSFFVNCTCDYIFISTVDRKLFVLSKNRK